MILNSYLEQAFSFKSQLNFDDFIDLITRKSSDLFFLPMIIMHKKLPCAENVFRMKNLYKAQFSSNKQGCQNNSPKVNIDSLTDAKCQLLAFPKLVDDYTSQQLLSYVPIIQGKKGAFAVGSRGQTSQSPKVLHPDTINGTGAGSSLSVSETPLSTVSTQMSQDQQHKILVKQTSKLKEGTGSVSPTNIMNKTGGPPKISGGKDLIWTPQAGGGFSKINSSTIKNSPVR